MMNTLDTLDTLDTPLDTSLDTPYDIPYDIIDIGFIGSVHGLDDNQKSNLFQQLVRFKRRYTTVNAHHGNYNDADKYFHELCEKLEFRIYINTPRHIPRHTSNPLPYFRNTQVVDFSDVLIACPFEKVNVVRCGTWSTIRYAEKRKRGVIILHRY